MGASAAPAVPLAAGALPLKSVNIKSACRLNTSIPHPTCCTYNISSASAYPRDRKGRMRKAKVDAHLGKLGASSDVLCLQETQLLELDHDSLGHSLDSFIFFVTMPPLGLKGGSPLGFLGPSPPVTLSPLWGWGLGWKAGCWC